jgi:hypothetical protein
MTQTTELREQTGARAGNPAQAAAGAWTNIKHVCVRAVFWTYKRGSWQYDLIVVAILGFIFLTPRSWYTLQPPPPVTGFLKNQGIVDIGRIKNNWSYFVDVRLVKSRPNQKPEEAVRDILSERLNRPLTLMSVDEIRDKKNVALGYAVVVQP